MGESSGGRGARRGRRGGPARGGIGWVSSRPGDADPEALLARRLGNSEKGGRWWSPENKILALSLLPLLKNAVFSSRCSSLSFTPTPAALFVPRFHPHPSVVSVGSLTHWKCQHCGFCVLMISAVRFLFLTFLKISSDNSFYPHAGALIMSVVVLGWGLQWWRWCE